MYRYEALEESHNLIQTVCVFVMDQWDGDIDRKVYYNTTVFYMANTCVFVYLTLEKVCKALPTRNIKHFPLRTLPCSKTFSGVILIALK